MVVYAETLPWLVELYMHTLEVRVDGARDGEYVLIPHPLLLIWCCLHALLRRWERKCHARTSSIDTSTFRMVALVCDRRD
jgi:hypothetical protein